MTYPATDDQEYPRMTSAVQALIAINVVILFLQMTIVQSESMAAALGFNFASAPSRWWTIVTYMFVHHDFWHLFWNMYALFIFGPRLEHLWGTKKFTLFYLMSGLGGLICYSLFFRDSGSLLLGASAAIFGVMGAYALQWPKQEVYLFWVLPMRVLTLVLLFVGFNLAMGVFGLMGGGTDVAYFAHLGGFVVAWLYMRTPPSVSIEQLRQRISQVPDTEDPPRPIPRALPRSRERVEEVDEIVAKSKAIAAKRPAAITPARKVAPPRDLKAEDVNRVLDKISAEGLDSLTSEERGILEEMSRRLRRE